MIIALDFDYVPSPNSLLVTIEAPSNNIVLDLQQQTLSLKIKFDLPVCNQTVKIKFCCSDPKIITYPLTISDIVLDEFYRSNSILHRGSPKFDQTFLHIAKQKKMYLDFGVNDSNRLDFTGELVYEFSWPFYKNIFQ